MKRMYVVEWKSRSGWESSACFSDSEDAWDFARSQKDKYPGDEYRVSHLRVVIVSEE